ncbi:hypothetical protein D3C87_1802780 [compost metagenome]
MRLDLLAGLVENAGQLKLGAGATLLVIGLAAGRQRDADLDVLSGNGREDHIALQVENAACLAVADVGCGKLGGAG